MSAGTVTYRCPNCDAGLLYDAEQHKFACEFCLSAFTEEELSATDSAARAEEAAEEARVFSEHVHGYICDSCGAQVMCDLDTAATECFYCHNPVVMTDKLSGVYKPSKIIPFHFDREKAKQMFLSYAKSKWFVPRDYYSEAQLEKISGIYYPFWVTDADARASFRARGHKLRTWRSGNYRYTETSVFAIERQGGIHFEDIVTSAISSEDKAMLEGILPYPTDCYQDFSMAYLQGFLAKKRDIERESINGEVRERMQGYTQTLLSRTAEGYHSIHDANTDMVVSHSHFDYSLLPLWVLTYKDKKDKLFTYAMNGHTGKIYGELPVSIPKLLLLFGMTFLAAAALIFLLGWGLFL